MYEFEQLLDRFKRLPPTPRNLTFMDVAGYAHYENVCSNILAFFFDPKEEHEMGDLLIRSLISLYGGDDEPVGSITVAREYQTLNGGRLDLVLSGGGLVVGIENKIYHWIANDLDDYACTIDQMQGDYQTRLKIVLGLHAPTQELPGGFKSITYEQLWRSVESRIGAYVFNASQKWLQYFLDFIQTTRNLTANAMQEFCPNDQFFIENHEVIDRLIKENNQFLSKLNSKIAQLKEIIRSEDAELAKHLVEYPWKSLLVFDFHLTDKRHLIALDLEIEPRGWGLTIFGRDKQVSNAFLARLIETSPQLLELQRCELATNGRRVVQRWGLQTDLGTLRAFLTSLSLRLQEAASNFKEEDR